MDIYLSVVASRMLYNIEPGSVLVSCFKNDNKLVYSFRLLCIMTPITMSLLLMTK